MPVLYHYMERRMKAVDKKNVLIPDKNKEKEKKNKIFG
jgi:hypothetical protein